MKKNLFLTALIFVSIFAKAQTNTKCFVEDLNRLIGSWQGSLTYLDYSSGKPYTMSANIEIHRIGETNQFSFYHTYPKEPNTNSIDTISLSIDGRYLDKSKVTSRNTLSNGDIEIITEANATDGNDHKKATIKHTYIIGKNTFIIRKEVKFDGEKVWLKRNEYSYKK